MHSEKLVSVIIENIAFCTFLSGENLFNVPTQTAHMSLKRGQHSPQ